ncbi:uncharacterized protein FPOAC1_013810 [Fusarium poae]|uniref:uncharacterized protein n=1 Tax=Fusarium poae TaxID=36050 RepID=UPI001D0380D8|nr:uncharacterized protein FPOAC1_013810 [Fusarium poae]KAG8664472.1 hypothetical protein FPOAC1_013810 [Fusarium poae]
MCRAEARAISECTSRRFTSRLFSYVKSILPPSLSSLMFSTTQTRRKPVNRHYRLSKKKKNVACSLRASNFSSAPSIGTTKDCSMDLTQSCQLWSGGHGSRIDGADSPGSVVSRDIPE